MTRHQLLEMSCVTIALRRTNPESLNDYDMKYLHQLNDALQSLLYRRYGAQKYKLICLMAGRKDNQ